MRESRVKDSWSYLLVVVLFTFVVGLFILIGECLQSQAFIMFYFARVNPVIVMGCMVGTLMSLKEAIMETIFGKQEEKYYDFDDED